MSDFLALTILLLLCAPAVGSFLAVLIDRLPRGEDVVRQPSACRSCRARLGPQDLVPLLSFVLLRGRCRHCGAPIPGWQVLVEIAALGAAVLALVAGDSPPEIALTALVLWLLLALGVSDLRWFRLPDALTVALIVTGLVAAALGLNPDVRLAHALIGAVLGSGSFWLLRLGYWHLRQREGLGLGDVKLMAGIGALIGPFDLALTVLLSTLAALCGVLLVAIRRGRALQSGQALPFGAALCTGAAAVWLIRLTAN